MKILGIVLLVYGLLLLFFAFMKNAFILKMVRAKFGKNMTEKTAINLIYIFGAVFAIVGLVFILIF